MFTFPFYVFLVFYSIFIGPERKSAVIEEKNRNLVAYHESGHAIVALFTPGSYEFVKEISSWLNVFLFRIIA